MKRVLVYIQSAMLTSVRLFHIDITSHTWCVWGGVGMMRAPEMYSLSECPVFGTELLTVVIMLVSRSRDLVILQNCTLVSSAHISPVPHLSAPVSYHSTLCFHVFDFVRFCI